MYIYIHIYIFAPHYLTWYQQALAQGLEVVLHHFPLSHQLNSPETNCKRYPLPRQLVLLPAHTGGKKKSKTKIHAIICDSTTQHDKMNSFE